MTPEESLAVVEQYYGAYQAGSAATVTTALGDVLDAAFTLESPLVEAQFGGPARGEMAIAAARGAAPFLQHAEIDSLYSTLDGTGAVALIHFPSPVGEVVQSEHFDIEPATGKITRLRSYYDPRKLLQSPPR